MKNKFTFIDLFSGIGGFHLALKNAGGSCIAYSEINKQAINTYCENLEMKKEHNLNNITQIEKLPSHDILTAGVPCQSWSIAGKKLGFDDDRGQLWNDTIYLLNQSQPKAFIFENVKGLADPRNDESFKYILNRIAEAGYFASFFLINSKDYGIPQNRQRVYIIGFKEEMYLKKFKIPKPLFHSKTLSETLSLNIPTGKILHPKNTQTNFTSLSSSAGYNDYFLFNDLRGGDTTIHSWDIINTTEKEKNICYLLMKNRRKKQYGKFDGNPLSLKHFQDIDKFISQKDIDSLVDKDIFKEVEYIFNLQHSNINDIIDTLSDEEILFLEIAFFSSTSLDQTLLSLEDVKSSKELKQQKININKTIASLKDKNIISCVEKRYDFKNGKISTGLFGINRIFLPSSKMFSTLVSSDTNDYIAELDIDRSDNFKQNFLDKIFYLNRYRKITKKEACLLQGFPEDYKLPEKRSGWMKEIGNSVSIPVIDMIIKSILETGVLKNKNTTF